MINAKQSTLVAHRGLQPENTLWAFKHAYAQGFEAAECDVWITHDYQVVVCHDETCKRTAISQGDLLDQAFSSLRYQQLQTILVGNTQHSEAVPLLKDLLAIIPEGKQLLVEIKFQDVQAISYFIDCIQLYLNKIIVISFYPDMLVELKKILPACRTILLTTAKQYQERTMIVNDDASLDQALLFIQQYHLDGIGFEYSDFISDNSVVSSRSLSTGSIFKRIPGSLLTQLWYCETDPEKVKNIIKTAREAGIGFVNVDVVM